jgi:hypothetical protein
VALGASQINIEEDITKFFPDDERVEKAYHDRRGYVPGRMQPSGQR